MKIRAVILILYGIAVSSRLVGQDANQSIQTGNDLYKQKKYDEAELHYNDALVSEPSNSTAKFNLANTLYRGGKQEEAIKALDDLAMNDKDAVVKSKAYYNKGVILSAQKKLEESIEAYKSALRQNPGDTEARENLQKALLELKKKNPPKKKEDEPKKKKQEQQQQKQQQQPKMNQKEAEQKLKLLEQKEKEVQQRMQKEKVKTGGNQAKDW
jgi:Ca-activated chloride channel homolog